MAVPIEKVARLQKEIVWRCNCAGKLVLVTRIFDSMADAPRPTRAEATDVANAVLDGVGECPVFAIAARLRVLTRVRYSANHRRLPPGR
jgi:pyruvate kinase